MNVPEPAPCPCSAARACKETQDSRHRCSLGSSSRWITSIHAYLYPGLPKHILILIPLFPPTVLSFPFLSFPFLFYRPSLPRLPRLLPCHAPRSRPAPAASKESCSSLAVPCLASVLLGSRFLFYCRPGTLMVPLCLFVCLLGFPRLSQSADAAMVSRVRRKDLSCA